MVARMVERWGLGPVLWLWTLVVFVVSGSVDVWLFEVVVQSMWDRGWRLVEPYDALRLCRSGERWACTDER